MTRSWLAAKSASGISASICVGLSAEISFSFGGIDGTRVGQGGECGRGEVGMVEQVRCPGYS